MQLLGLLLRLLEPLVIVFRFEVRPFRVIFDAGFLCSLGRLLVAQVLPFTSFAAAAFG